MIFSLRKSAQSVDKISDENPQISQIDADLLHRHISHTSGYFLSATPCNNQDVSPQSAQSPQRGGGAGVKGGWGAGERGKGAAPLRSMW